MRNGDAVAVRGLCILLALLLLVPASMLMGCGVLFWGAVESQNRGDLNVGALVLDLLALPILGIIPLIVDLAAGGLWHKKGYRH